MDKTAESVEGLKAQASLVIDTLNNVLDSAIPLLQLYPELTKLHTDTELAIDTIQRFYRTLVKWRLPEIPHDVQFKRMQRALELIEGLGRRADQRLKEMRLGDGDADTADVACYGAFRQLGEIASDSLGNGWLANEDDDADLLA